MRQAEAEEGMKHMGRWKVVFRPGTHQYHYNPLGRPVWALQMPDGSWAGGYTTGGLSGQVSAVVTNPAMTHYEPAVLLHEAKEALYLAHGKRAHKDGATGVGF